MPAGATRGKVSVAFRVGLLLEVRRFELNQGSATTLEEWARQVRWGNADGDACLASCCRPWCLTILVARGVVVDLPIAELVRRCTVLDRELVDGEAGCCLSFATVIFSRNKRLARQSRDRAIQHEVQYR